MCHKFGGLLIARTHSADCLLLVHSADPFFVVDWVLLLPKELGTPDRRAMWKAAHDGAGKKCFVKIGPV